MNLACTVEYLDDADIFGTVDGVIMLTESKPAKGTVLAWLISDSRPDGGPEEIDLLENAEITEQTDGTIRIHADSKRAEEQWGPGNSKVNLRVVPR